MDEFKKYVQHHKDELNQDEPRPQVWQQIRQEVSLPKKINVVILATRWAAAACILVLVGIGIWYVLNDSKITPVALNPVTKAEKAITIPPITTQPELIEKRPPLVTVRAEKTVSLKKLITTQPENIVDRIVGQGALKDIETSFTQVINLQRARVRTMPMYAETPEYFNDFKIQIRQMEKDEKVIKSDIAKRGMNDALLDQLINLYQQKLTILKQLQIEMNKTNNRFKQNRVPVDSARTYFLNI